MEETPVPKPKQKKEKKCSSSPFTFTLVLCVVLGCVLIIVPLNTFKSEDYVKKLSFSMTAQFFMPQIDKYDSLVFSSNNKTGASMYIYNSGAVLQPIERGWAHQYEFNDVIDAEGAVVFPILYVKDTFLSVDALGENGCLLEFKNLDQEQYNNFDAKGGVHVQTKRGFQGLSNSCKYNTTFTSFGKSYAVLENKGQKAKVRYRVSIKSPFYNISSATRVHECIDTTYCKYENLPRNYFAVVDLYTHEQASVANVVTLTQQFNDKFRWGFPIGIYVSLFMIVAVVGFGQMIAKSVQKRKSTSSYSTIEDPLDKESPAIN